jgi:hypothetical protein
VTGDERAVHAEHGYEAALQRRLARREREVLRVERERAAVERKAVADLVSAHGGQALRSALDAIGWPASFGEAS